MGVTVRNVSPRITSASVADPLGQDLGAASAFAIAGLPVTLEATFTDPGIADTQTAAVEWGDGTLRDTTFLAFADASSGSVGRLRDTRTFAPPGSYRITLTITDDDGGAAARELAVEVLSIEEAVEAVAGAIRQRLDVESDSRIAAALRLAHDELVGNHGGTPPTNGALDQLEADDPTAAITKLKAAISALLTAESRGAGGLLSHMDRIGLVARAVATAAYHEAEAAATPVDPGEARTLAAIADLIGRGSQQLAMRQFLRACDTFRQATSKALQM